MPKAATKRRRQRNKSSPSECVKKNKVESVYTDSEDIMDSNSEHSDSELGTPITKGNIAELGAIISKQLRGDIVSELKTELINIIRTEIRSELKDIGILKGKVSSLEAENAKLRAELHDRKIEIDEIDQYGRRMCLNICNVPGDTGDSSENVTDKLLALAKKADIDISSGDIDRCHRLGRQKGATSRKIIVKFTNSTARQRVYNARKKIGSGIFIQENLTRYREGLAYEARQLVRSKHLDKTWVAGCRIYANVTVTGHPHGVLEIKDLAILERIRRGDIRPSDLQKSKNS